MTTYDTLEELANIKNISLRTAIRWLDNGKIIKIENNKGKKLCYIILKEALQDLVNNL